MVFYSERYGRVWFRGFVVGIVVVWELVLFGL